MKRVHPKAGKPEERSERTSSVPPLSEPPAGDYKRFTDAKLFEYAYELLKMRHISRAEALSDFKPELCTELRRRNLMELLTHSLNVSSMDCPAVEAEIAEVFRRQLLPTTPEEIKKLVSLIPALYTLPDFQHVKDKATLAGIILTDDEVRKMCWVLRGYINHMNTKDGAP